MSSFISLTDRAAVANQGGAMGADTISKNGEKMRNGVQGKRCFSLLAFLFLTSLVFAQTNLQDVVYLKNGSIIRGTIIEQIPNQSIRLQTADGNVFGFQMEDIERLTREPRVGNNPTVERGKSPGLAWGLSFLVPGVGQFYNGDNTKGFLFLGGAVAGNLLMIGSDSFWASGYDIKFRSRNTTLYSIGLVVYLGSWIWAQIDAPISVRNKNLERGFLSWDLGGSDAFIALQPEFNFTPLPGNQIAPTYGLGLKLKF